MAELPLGILQGFIHAAERLNDWSLVIYCRELLDQRLRNNHQRGESYQQSDTAKKLPADSCDNILSLAFAYRQMGLPIEALECLRLQLLFYYDEPRLIDYYQQCCDEFRTAMIHPDEMVDENIILTPLRQQHLVDFYWQYADPAIAKLCNLPDFVDDDHWLDWLALEQKADNHWIFAVMHREGGFIGSVSLEVFNGVGYFYYWLGQDFQGYGFGPQVVKLLLQWGEAQLGMHCCYAKAFEHNAPSHHRTKH